MKHEKWLTWLSAWLIAFFAAFGGAACMVTGFDMGSADLSVVAAFCAVYAAIAAVCCRFRWGTAALSVVAVLLGYLLWQNSLGSIQDEIAAMLYYISSVYDSGYHWGVIKWWDPAALEGVPMTWGLCAVAVPAILGVCRTVCRQKRAFWAVAAAVLPLASCLVVTDTVPDVWCLFSLLAALLMLMLTQSVRRRAAMDANRLTAMLLVPVVLAMSVLFWAVPPDGDHADKVMQMLADWHPDLSIITGSGSGDGGGTKVNLGGMGALSSSRYHVMDVKTSYSGTLYLRGRAYENYDGKSWGQSDVSSSRDGLWPTGEGKFVSEVMINTRYTNVLLYFPYYAGGNLWPSRMEEGAIPNPTGLKSYSFRQYDFTGRRFTGGDPVRVSACMQLPLNTIIEAGRILQENGISTGGDTRQTALTIAQLVKNTAEYDRDTGMMPSTAEDFAIWFLEDAETGYCVHYATAATVLLRAAGIPARYVTGYMTEVTADQWVEVTADRAHAWVEYFDKDTGWTMLEVTPVDEEEPTQPSVIPETTTPSPETTLPSEETTGPGASVGTRPSDEEPVPTTGQEQEQEPEEPLNLWWLERCLTFLAWTAGITLPLWGQYELRLRLRRKRMAAGHRNRQALRRWRQVTWEAWLIRERPPKTLLSLAKKAKFSQHTLTQEELAAFDEYLEHAKQVRKTKNWLWRLTVRLLFALE